MEPLDDVSGALDDVTILRYAHVYRNRHSGGVEQHLWHLNRRLLQRNRMTILQMHLTDDEGHVDPVETETVGMGRLCWVAVGARRMNRSVGFLPGRIRYLIGRQLTVGRRNGNSWARTLLSALTSLSRHAGGHLRYDTMVFSDHLAEIFTSYPVDLLALHWLHYDADGLISSAVKRGTPFVFINHFDNLRYSRKEMRRWVPRAAAIAGVTGRNVPAALEKMYYNLSAAVDADFFSPDKASPTKCLATPLVLLPARIARGKGHHDLIEVVRALRTENVDLMLAFAGVVDSEGLDESLRARVAALGLEGRVSFLGELCPDEVRNWYAASSVVVLPSYTEGVGRVLLEAQAMKKPVIAYDCGGIRESILDKRTGFVVPKGNLSALAGKLRFLLENDQERSNMGERGRAFVTKHFGMDALVARHEAFYLKAIRGKHAQDGIE